MVTRHTHNGVTWVDLESPTREELQTVMQEFAIDSRIEEEIISPTPYPLVVIAPKYLYLILHFPTTDPRGGARNQEIDFIIGRNFLITARYEVISPIHTLHRIFESEELLGLPKHATGGADILERILRQLYGAISDQAEQTARTLERVEDDIFNGKQRAAVYQISLAGRILLRFDTTLVRHKEPLETFLNELTSTVFFGKEFREHAAHIMAEHDHAANIVSSYRAVLRELRITNDSLLSTSQNEIVTRLTIVTFAAFPLTIIAGIFGMNTDTIPFIKSPHAFWIILLLMAITLLTFLTFFKIKKWI